METAIGVIVAVTTAFGRIVESAVESRNQNRICVVSEVPTILRNAHATLLSSPTISHDTVRMDAPRSSRIVSDA